MKLVIFFLKRNTRAAVPKTSLTNKIGFCSKLFLDEVDYFSSKRNIVTKHLLQSVH